MNLQVNSSCFQPSCLYVGAIHSSHRTCSGLGEKVLWYAACAKMKTRSFSRQLVLVDLKPFLDGEIFEPLKDVDYLGTVRLDPDTDTIVWDNGADMSPDFLYEIGVIKKDVELVA